MNFQELVNSRYNFIKTEYLNTNTIKFSKKYGVGPSKVISMLGKKKKLKTEVKQIQEVTQIKHDYYYEEGVQVINGTSSTCFKNYITK